VAIVCHQDCVGPAGLPHPLPKPVQRDIGAERNLLRGPQPEAPQAFGGNNLAQDQPLGADGFLLSAQGAVGGNRAGVGKSQQHRLTHLCAQPLGGGLVEDDFARLRQVSRPAVAQLPEAGVAANQLHTVRPQGALPVGILQAHPQQNRRHGVACPFSGRRHGGQFVGQLRPKEPIRYHRGVDPPEAIEDQPPQTAAHRIAH
jgi:hypothetical protein